MAVLEKIEEKYLSRLSELIEMGRSLPSGEFEDWLEEQSFTQWLTSSKILLSKIPISQNHYLADFSIKVQHPREYARGIGLGILNALKDDIKSGMLQNTISFIQTEIFSDFLEMAEHIFEQGHKDPPVMLAGAVMEDSLRKICTKNEIPVLADSNIASLNQLLLQKQVYNKIVFKQVDTWKAIRDFADHANYDQYDRDKVKDMLDGVRKFVGEYLG
jgi:hypothetical protein